MHGITRIRVLIVHATETGRKRDADGQLIEALFVKTVTVEHNGNRVAECHFGVGISHNPYFTVHLTDGKSGDAIKVHWLNNVGQTESTEAIIH